MTRKPQGFAAMNPEAVRRIARLGGKAAQAKGVAHRWTAEEAQAAGQRGGRAAAARREERARDAEQQDRTGDLFPETAS